MHLEASLEAALEEKTSALEENLGHLNELQRAEKDLIDALKHVQLLQEERLSSEKLLEAKNEALDAARKEASLLRKELLMKEFGAEE